MKYLNKYLSILLSFFLITPAFSQDEEEDQGSGQSTAEAAVTGSASQPSVSTSGAIDSNPIVLAIAAGMDPAVAIKTSPSQMATIISTSGSISNLKDSINDLETAINSGDDDLKAYVAKLEQVKSSGNWNSFFETTNTVLLATASAVADSQKRVNSYLEAAVTTADSFLVDKAITSSIPDPKSLSYVETQATYEMLLLLNNYGAFGDNGDVIVAASGLSSGQSLTAESSTSDYLTYLGTIIGKSTIDKNLKDADGNPISVINVPTSNIQVSGANSFTLGSSTEASTVNVSTLLPAVAYTDADESPAEENILIVGAINDVFTAGAVTFTNTNDAEDHVLAIGAGDQVGIYHDITYTGSNLAIGQKGKPITADTKTSVINDQRALLIQADISTGGNLAIGSLGQIQVKGATFTLGTANADSSAPTGYTSDADNLYIYANDLIEINGLSFGSSARLDDVYMEAITINLKDVTFPSASDVFLRTRDGEIAFGTFSSPTVGAANFTNVVHPDVSSSALTSSDFTQLTNGQYQTTHNAVTVGKL